MGFDTRFLNPHKVENSTIRPKANMGLRCGWCLVGIFQATWASTSEHGEFGIACLCIHPHTEPDNDTCMVVKIPIWILRSYDFTISLTQNDLNLSRIFAVVQDRYDRTILTIPNNLGFL